ncbi:hypothetical protein D6445_11235 [Salmonella enterica subsp. enterica serovar Infantis]|nr:hypothetical protein [Salmonella enterica subsp. enterica serovar Infantis]
MPVCISNEEVSAKVRKEDAREAGLPAFLTARDRAAEERRVRNGRSKRAVDVQASLAIRQDGDTGGGSA